jgi:hypothetical protein
LSYTFNIDQLNLTESTAASEAAFVVIDSLQQLDPASVRLPAAAIVLILLCERFDLKLTDVLDKASRMMRDALEVGKGEHIRAIQMYLKEELQ